MLNIRFFGSPEICVDNTPVRRITASPTLTQLFAYCVTYRHQPHTREKLAALLWPDLPDTRMHRNLNNALWEMRQHLKLAQAPPEAYWLCDNQTVQFNPRAPIQLDIAELEVASQCARQQDFRFSPKAILQLEQAVALYRGDFLEGVYADWCAPLREQFREAYFILLETLIRHYQTGGRIQEAAQAAQKLAQADPLREEAHFQLIQLYAAANRVPEANAQYEHYAALWREELHTSPSARMEALARQINSVSNSATLSLGDEVLANNLEIIKTLAPLLRRHPAVKHSGLSAWGVVAEHSEQAGRRFKARFANTEALQYFILAIEALGKLPASLHRDQRELNIRRACDELYDLNADTPSQADNLQKAMRLAGRAKDPEERADILARQAWLARRQGQYPSALAYLQKMLNLCQSVSTQTYAALAHRLLGIMHDEMGNFCTALEQHTAALNLDKQLRLQQGLYLDHINLSSVLTGMGHYAKAMKHLEKAAAVILPESSRLAEATIAGNRGNLWLKLGQWERARQDLRRALELVQQTSDQETECWLGSRLAFLYHQLGESNHALQLAHHFYRRAVDIQASRRATELAEILAQVYIGLSHGKEAMEWANITFALSRKHDLRRYQLRSLMRQAQAQGVVDNWRLALKKAHAAVTVFENWAQPLEEEAELFWIFAQCAKANGKYTAATQAQSRAYANLKNVAKQNVAPQWCAAFLNSHIVQLG